MREALQQENEQLRRSVRELALLNEVATALWAARDLDSILCRIVREALAAVGASV